MKLNADRTQLRRSEPEPELNIFLGSKGTHTQTSDTNREQLDNTERQDRTQTRHSDRRQQMEQNSAKDKTIFKKLLLYISGSKKTVTLY